MFEDGELEDEASLAANAESEEPGREGEVEVEVTQKRQIDGFDGSFGFVVFKQIRKIWWVWR